MRTASSSGGRVAGAARYFSGQTVLGLLVAALSGGLFWLVWIYGMGLRDPRYLDGWVLAGGMGLQLCFHIAIKTARLSPKSASALRTFHIFTGYLLIAAFISHCDFSWPDSGLEWALWAAFVLVTLSGIFGTYLAWSQRAKGGTGERVGDDRMKARRAELAQAVQAIVAAASVEMTDQSASVLPAPPYHAWIKDLYTHHLKDFFHEDGNAITHLTGSRRPLKRLTEEIANLSPYVDKQAQEKLEAIKTLAVEKDRLELAAVHVALTKGWLLVHVPITYALIVLTVLHVLVVYAFSSGVW